VKLHPDRLDAVNAISRLDRGRVWVNAEEYGTSVLVPWRGEVHRWEAQDFEELTARHFEAIAELRPEIVIFGSGRRLRFPPTAVLRPLIDRRIGFETMDSSAACRTYNVLVSEGRSVLAALLIEA
jgi:uncharacterized protein